RVCHDEPLTHQGDPVVIEATGLEHQLGGDSLRSGDRAGGGPDPALGDVDGRQDGVGGNALAGAGDGEVIDEGELVRRRPAALGQRPGGCGEQPAAVPGDVGRIQSGDLANGGADLADDVPEQPGIGQD